MRSRSRNVQRHGSRHYCAMRAGLCNGEASALRIVIQATAGGQSAFSTCSRQCSHVDKRPASKDSPRKCSSTKT
ncbi:hypothetical protein DOTSEDRAFT_177406, partial [Dothistroma septosporum NZE10]